MAKDELAKREPTAEELRAQLTVERRELVRSANGVKSQLTSVRTWVRDYHFAFIVGAFAVGYWVGNRRR